MKQSTIAADAALRALLEETASAKPAACVKRLCAADYAVTRKELMNYRNRQTEEARCAELPDVNMAEMAALLGVNE